MPKAPRENVRNTSAGPTVVAASQQVATLCKSIIVERRKARPTPLAAKLYKINFFSDEPLPKTHKCPPFRNSSAPRTLGLSPAKTRPATVSGNVFLKSSRRPGCLGKVEQKQTTKRAGNR